MATDFRGLFTVLDKSRVHLPLNKSYTDRKEMETGVKRLILFMFQIKRYFSEGLHTRKTDENPNIL